MAKHNYAMLNGQVRENPRLIKNASGAIERIICPILVIRGVRDFGNNIDHIKYDSPFVMTNNPELIKIMKTWEKGDMVEIKGSVTTKDIVKSTTCKHCGHKHKKNGNMVYINPIFACVHEKRLSPSEGLEILKARCEISNQVTLIGPVCREPQLFVTDNGLSITTYQMAVRRKYRIASDSSDNKTDFPWVKSYGAIAKNDAASIKKGAYIFVDGMIQTRELDRIQVCEECGKEYHWNDFAMEIVPFATEYLRDYYTKEDIQKREAEAGALAAKSVLSESVIDAERPLDAPVFDESTKENDSESTTIKNILD